MDRPLSPKERREQASALGAGMFSAIAAQQYKSRLARKAEEAAQDDALAVNIPQAWYPKTAGLIGDAFSAGLNNVSGPAQDLLHARQGFKDRARGYMTDERKKLKTDMDKAEKQYLEHLTKVRDKTASANATPCLDDLCIGIASALDPRSEKIAGADDEESLRRKYTMNDGALAHVLSEILSPVKRLGARAAAVPATIGLGTAGAAGLAAYGIRDELNQNGGLDRDDLRVPTRVLAKVV